MSKHPFHGLSVRTSNALLRFGCSTKQQVRKGVRNKSIHPSNTQAFGIGWKSYSEIRVWLGMKIPTSQRIIVTARSQIALMLSTGRLVEHNDLPVTWSFEDINRIMRLGSKEKARQLVAKGQRLAKKGTK